jgi:hypothetical protein
MKRALLKTIDRIVASLSRPPEPPPRIRWYQ